MRKAAVIICLSLSMALKTGCLLADEAVLPVWLIRNWEDPNSVQPVDFRTMQDNPHREGQTALLSTRIGLLFLRASGSAQFSEKNLLWIKNKLAKYKITIVDLRQEAHGFLNGLPISWYMGEDQVNRGKSLAEIETDEAFRLDELLAKKNITVYKLDDPDGPQGFRRGVDPELVKVNDVFTEKQLCADLGLYYVRLPVADYQRPADKEVDRFIELVRSMGQDSWLHIHCAQGVGRTTTFLAMFDMMHNAKYVSLEDIIKRQWLLGGTYLLSTAVNKGWEYPYAEERTNFIRHFYQYCQNNNDDFKQPWSEWVKEMESR